MPAVPLVIDATPDEIRVLASPLELQNRKTVQDTFDYNVRLADQKKRDSNRHLRAVAEEAAGDLTR
jgi:hypothetical protein